MDNEIKTWLKDISRAIEEIYDFLPGKKNFFDFKKDLKTKRAIERNIEIIGEASRRIYDIQPNIPITALRKIIDTRNRIIHGYDSVSDDIIWSIVTRNLPLLQEEVTILLENDGYE